MSQLKSIVERIERLNAEEETSLLTLSEQAEALRFVARIVSDCQPCSKRNLHRAYWLGSKILGLDYEDAREILHMAVVSPTAADRIVARYPNFIVGGEQIGSVYFARDPISGAIKIGHSRDVPQRIKTLSTITRRPLELLHTFDGFMLHEHRIHVRARAAWIGGEWYDPSALRGIPCIPDQVFGGSNA